MAGSAVQSNHGLPTPITPAMPECLSPVAEPIPTLPMTPPDLAEDNLSDQQDHSRTLAHALHVIATQKQALDSLSHIYATQNAAQTGFLEAVEHILRSVRCNGKLVIIGVGKSGYIGQKLKATLLSLSIPCTFLHPTEALHGDLGTIRAVSQLSKLL